MRIFCKVKNQLYMVVILVVRNWRKMTLMLAILIFMMPPILENLCGLQRCSIPWNIQEEDENACGITLCVSEAFLAYAHCPAIVVNFSTSINM